MSTISACKANLTKAHTALEAVKGKIPQYLIDPYDDVTPGSADERQLLDQRQEALRTHLSNIRSAVRTIRERQQAFLTFVSTSANAEADNEAYTDYMQDTKLENSIVEAEGLIHTLQANLEEACLRSEALRAREIIQQRQHDSPSVEEQYIESTTCGNIEQPRQSVFPQTSPRKTSPYGQSDLVPVPPFSAQIPRNATIQLGKLNLEPFDGDITQFQRFWCAFEVAVHNDATIDPMIKFLYLQSLLKGDAQIVLQDLEPDECNYYELVRALKKRYDRPHRTRATLHKQLQQLPVSSNSGSDLRNTWFRISGILRGLRKYEDFRTVLPILDLVKGKFPSEIQQKLHDLEFQSGVDFDLHQIMHHLDHIIASKEKYEDSSTLRNSYSVNSASYQSVNRSSHQRTSSRSISPRCDPSQCAFCGTRKHTTRYCSVKIPVGARINIARAYNLCWRCLRQGHSRSGCQYPACRRCSGDHHDLLCKTHSRDESLRRSPHRRDYHRSRRHDYERNRHDYRSPSRDRYPSRSPSLDNYERRRYTHSERFRTPSSERYHQYKGQRARSPSRRFTPSPNRVRFQSPVRDREGYESNRSSHSSRRASSPYESISRYHDYDSEAELEQLNHCYQSNNAKRTNAKAALMLVNAVAHNYDATAPKKVVLLLDSGAQNSFITTDTARRLGLPVRDKKQRTFVTFGGHETTEATGVVNVTLVDSADQTLTLRLTTKDTITLPQVPPQLPDVDIKFIKDNSLQLPSCRSSYPVLPDILIGAPSLSTLRHGSDTYEVRFCRLWQLGFLHGLSESTNTNGVLASFDADEDAAKRLWSLDSIGITDDHNPDADDELNARILRQFHSSSRLIDGFLYVQFPWKSPHPKLLDNKQLAYCRLVSQYNRLRSTPSAWKQYAQTIEDHLVAGFIEEVDEHVYDSHRIYYIPHQAVYKESSSTTKLRIVFDASSKTRGAPSLNDCIHQGPTLLPELAGILLRARLCRFLLSADVEKAFHQIRLQHSQRDATRFLWLKDPFSPPSSTNLRFFRFTRVPFGINASPFMLAAAIRYYLRHLGSPLSNEIERNTYVDNVALGAASQKEAIEKYRLVKSVFGSMHMNLREFVCNSDVVNNSIPKQDRVINNKRTTLLGIAWNYHEDNLHIALKTLDVKVHSKRTALRALASTYDPLGLLTPFLTQIKMFIQDLWTKKLAWDDPLDESDRKRWSDLLGNLRNPLPPIPRLVVTSSLTSCSIELCVFGDASQRLYACCAYLLCRSSTSASSRLVMARSRLNDLKPVTIPRAELLAVLISARLAQYVVQQLDITISAIHFFSDSQIALHWIHSKRHFKTFVQNRVNAIKNILASLQAEGIATKFYYVTSEDNPADCATRGLSTAGAKDHIWWTGPSFLLQPSQTWPNTQMDFTVPLNSKLDCESEYQTVHTTQQRTFQSVLPFTVTNKYVKLLNITAYILRFLHVKIFIRITSSMQKRLAESIPQVTKVSATGILTADDMIAAESVLILGHYREHEHILRRLPLSHFHARRTDDDLIRCPARIGPLFSAPILLLPSHRLTTIIAFHHHNTQYHAGVYATIASLRKSFFIPSIRSLVSKTLRTCVVCKRNNGHAYRYPEMPQLPKERVTRSRPFQNVGIDYLGPLVYKNIYSTSNKIWICLITCMATRAVHLEPVLNNTVQEFLLAFRRFIARRGTPNVIYSDNSTTFHAADDAIANVIYSPRSWRNIAEYSAKHKISWRFITPLSPWKGGFYERMVQLFKNAFRKSVGRSLLSLEQFHTTVVEIEAVINSRPITPFRERDAFVHALKPVDFISPEVNIEIPSYAQKGDFTGIEHRLADWHRDSIRTLDRFWDLWCTDYLAALRERHQLRMRQPRYTTAPPRVNDVVIVADDKLNRGQWPLGLIIKINISADQKPRSADVRMTNGKTLTRSLAHLYPLEIQAQCDYGRSSTKAHKATNDILPQRKQPARIAKTNHKFIH